MEWSKVRNLLAIRLDNLGDVFICEPALRALKEGIPGARLTLMASPNGARAAELLPCVDDVLIRRVVWQDAHSKMPLDATRERQLVEDIRRRAFDAAVIFTSFSQSPYPPAYACYLAEVPLRVGQSKEFGGSLLTTWVKAGPDDMHQVDRNLRLIEAIGLPVEDRDMHVHVPSEARASIAEKLAGKGIAEGQEFVVLNPTASCSARSYSPSRFAKVASALADCLPMVVTGEARDGQIVRQVLEEAASDRLVSLCGQTSVAELVALIERSSLLISNLTSTAHIASAVGTPTVLLFPGTELLSQWEPRGCPLIVLRRHADCSPCYLFDCPGAHQCLDITPDEVVEACRKLLRGDEPDPKGRGDCNGAAV